MFSCKKVQIDDLKNPQIVSNQKELNFSYYENLEDSILSSISLYETKSLTIDPLNEDNPYDFVGQMIVEGLRTSNVRQMNLTNSKLENFESDINSAIDYDLLPKINSSLPLGEEERKIIDKVISKFSIPSTNGFISVAKVWESATSRLLQDENQIKRTQLIITNLKYLRYAYSSEGVIVNGADVASKDWEGEFDYCMRQRLGAIFADDGNPVPETIFIAGIPGTFLAEVAICTYEATFNS